MTTLLFLVFSGLFSHSIIKISGSQIMQLRQISTAYKAKGVLNMGESILNERIQQSKRLPARGVINTSLGEIEIKKTNNHTFRLTIVFDNGMEYSKESIIEVESQETGETMEDREPDEPEVEPLE